MRLTNMYRIEYWKRRCFTFYKLASESLVGPVEFRLYWSGGQVGYNVKMLISTPVYVSKQLLKINLMMQKSFIYCETCRKCLPSIVIFRNFLFSNLSRQTLTCLIGGHSTRAPMGFDQGCPTFFPLEHNWKLLEYQDMKPKASLRREAPKGGGGHPLLQVGVRGVFPWFLENCLKLVHFEAVNADFKTENLYEKNCVSLCRLDTRFRL